MKSHTRGQIRGGRRYFENLRLGRVQHSFREGYFQISAPKLIQSVLPPKISSLAFQAFLLLTAYLASKMVLLQSMPARYGLPTVHQERCPPIRKCTSPWTGCLTQVDQSVVRRNLRTLKTISEGTTDIRRELHARIVFPRHTRLSSCFTLIGGTTNAKAMRAE